MSVQSVTVSKGTWILAFVLLIWGLGVAVAAQTGLYRMLYPPLIAPIVALGIIGPMIIYAFSPGFRDYISAIGILPLTAFHVWRIPAALLFVWYGSQDLLPEAFVRNAAWGDLLAGLFALLIIVLPKSRGRYLAFHLFGFADFVIAVGSGLAFTLMGDPRMDSIRTLPMALIPLYGVGISGASHLMAFDLLRKGVRAGSLAKAGSTA